MTPTISRYLAFLPRSPAETRAVAHEYRRLRAKGWDAAGALRSARVNVRFEAEEGNGRVKLKLEPDENPDLSWLDDVDYHGEGNRRAGGAYRKEWLGKAERDGVWIIVGLYREAGEGEWITADYCGGFIGDDVRDNGYDTDIKASALEALYDSTESGVH